VSEANDYVQRNSLSSFALVSNQFSLARMVHPIWDGCISAGDAASRAWLTRTQTPLLAWSSQARDFSCPDARRRRSATEDEELVRLLVRRR
jgi:hypothetical protein